MGILVSVNTITYNHEKYIANAIESFLRQETTFDFEILIGEDCSTDGTRSIVESYAALYPDKVRLVTGDHNIGARENARRLIRQSQGQYIAICEGDDYWTDNHKLQKQVDFMVRHPECSMCFHAAEVVDVRTGKPIGNIRPHAKTMLLPSNRLFFGGGNTVPTASILYVRSFLLEFPEFYNHCPVGDHPLALLLSYVGRIGYINEVMAVRNLWVPQSWNTLISSGGSTDGKIRHKEAMIRLLMEYDDYSANRYHHDVILQIIQLKREILKLYNANPFQSADFMKAYHALRLFDKLKIRFYCQFPTQVESASKWKQRIMNRTKQL